MRALPHLGLFTALALLLPLAVGAQRDGCRSDEAKGSAVTVAGPDEPGDRLLVTGRVLDRDGTSALPGVRVRVFQTDDAGWYSDGGMDESAARLCGVFETDAEGAYRVNTILPGAYATGDGPEPHLHFDLDFPDGRTGFVTVAVPDVVDGGDPGAGDARARRRPVVRDDDGLLRVVADLWVR